MENAEEPSKLFQSDDLSIAYFENDDFRNQFSDPFLPSTNQNRIRANEILKQVQNETNGYRSESKTIEEIADWVNSRFVYDENYTLTGMGDALADGRGICWHYAYLFDALVHAYGFQTKIIYGIAKNQHHIWNAVLYKGEWKYFDIGAKRYWMTEKQLENSTDHYIFQKSFFHIMRRGNS